MANSKYIQGVFKPWFPEKYVGDANNVVYRSSWENKLMHWCDNNSSVLQWSSEEVVIPYFSRADGKMRRYFVDFMIKFIDKNGNVQTAIIEIKPNKETRPPVKGKKKAKTYLQECYTWEVNQDKWAAAKTWAEKKGMIFLIFDEYDLGLKKRPGK